MKPEVVGNRLKHLKINSRQLDLEFLFTLFSQSLNLEALEMITYVGFRNVINVGFDKLML